MSISTKTLRKIPNSISARKFIYHGRVSDQPATYTVGTGTHLHFTTDMYCLLSTRIDVIFLRSKVLALLSNEK